jgi:branched-chain amino acid transport system permease protein
MDKFIQLTISGIADGAILALVALGFVLIFKSSDVINFAQGELLMIGAYLTYATISQVGLVWPIGVGVAVALAGLAGVLIEQLVLRPLIGEPVISVIMVTIGLSSLLRAIVGASSSPTTPCACWARRSAPAGCGRSASLSRSSPR